MFHLVLFFRAAIIVANSRKLIIKHTLRRVLLDFLVLIDGFRVSFLPTAGKAEHKHLCLQEKDNIIIINTETQH